MPKSFTYGEASIVVQGFVIFLSNLFFKLMIIFRLHSNCSKDFCFASDEISQRSSNSNRTSMLEQLTTILQVFY